MATASGDVAAWILCWFAPAGGSFFTDAGSGCSVGLVSFTVEALPSTGAGTLAVLSFSRQYRRDSTLNRSPW